jgi:UDP-glucose 4-epimerase
MTAPVVWITGAGGFIGSHLAASLRGQGVRVLGFGRSGGALPALTEAGLLAALDQSGAPSRVYHLAGGSTVGRSLADPLADFDSNVAATALVLDVVRREAPAVPIVLTSSAAVYGAALQGAAGGLSCDQPLTPVSPYGHHKMMAEGLGRSFASAFGMRITALRLFSIYGSGLRKQLLFDLCGKLASGQTSLMLGGTGAELRDWCHVADVVRGLAGCEDAPEGAFHVYNLATGQGTSVAGMARRLIGLWGGGQDLAFSGQSRAGDPFSLVADPSSLPPGFAPRVTLDQGLAEYVAWFRQEAGA